MAKATTNDMVIDGFSVQVSWEPGKHVQIATTNAHSTLTLPVDVDGERAQPFHGWHVTLDKAGINRLLRQLRLARHDAFGQDG